MNLYHWWYGIVDSWFGITITIGIIAMIGGAVVSIIKSIGHKRPDAGRRMESGYHPAPKKGTSND